MDEVDGGAETLRWAVMFPEAVDRIIEEALRDDAWWIAVRTGQYVQGTTVWADCIRPRVVIPRILRGTEYVESVLRRSGGDG